MNSALIAGTHHIFFPPRLEVVAGKDNTDLFAAYLVDDATAHRLLGDEPRRPARVADGTGPHTIATTAASCVLSIDLGGFGRGSSPSAASNPRAT
jgi:hypothetical protein